MLIIRQNRILFFKIYQLLQFFTELKKIKIEVFQVLN